MNMPAALKNATNEALDPQEEARAGCYALLARLFYAAPDAGLLQALAHAMPLDAHAADAALPAAWDALRGAAAEADPGSVHAEYDDTFIGVDQPEVLLYGSYYLAGFLNERPLVELRSDLAALGFTRAEDASEPEDHIAALADVMRRLILDGEDVPGGSAAAQCHFFVRHIATWYGRLCDGIEADANVDFYRGVAVFARAFLDMEREYLRTE